MKTEEEINAMQSIGGCASFIFANLFRKKSTPGKETTKEVEVCKRIGERSRPTRVSASSSPESGKASRERSPSIGMEDFTRFVDGLPSISPTQPQSKQRLDGVYLPTETLRTPAPYPETPVYTQQHDTECGWQTGEGVTTRGASRTRSSFASVSGLFGSYCRITGKDGELSRIPLFLPEDGETEGEPGERQVDQ